MSTPSSYTFPIAFRDVHYFALLYRANAERVYHRLIGTDLKPALFAGRSPMVAVGLIHYKDSDLGAYNEVILAIPVVPAKQDAGWKNWMNLYSSRQNRAVGQYIIHIPVTTQQSVDAGCGIWGYPKIKLPIEHQFGKQELHSTIFSTEHSPTIEFQGSLGISLPVPGMNLMTYSLLNGHWMKTWVDVQSNMRCRPFADVRINPLQQSTEMAREIALLGIADRSPLLTLEASKFSAKFHAPEPMHQ